LLLQEDSLGNKSILTNPIFENEYDYKILNFQVEESSNKIDPSYDDISQIDFSNERENSNFSSSSTAATSSASVSNTPLDTDSLSELCSTSVLSTSSSSDNDNENNEGDSIETSLVEEDLEAKKRQLHRAAKLLLKKNKKLRKNFALTSDFLIENISRKADQLVSESVQKVNLRIFNLISYHKLLSFFIFQIHNKHLVLRKSQRKRKTNSQSIHYSRIEKSKHRIKLNSKLHFRKLCGGRM
jgi:hypothetical protein